MKTRNEPKYRILAEAERKGHRIYFDVLYNASSFGYDNIDEEIGQKEGELIRKYNPALNT